MAGDKNKRGPDYEEAHAKLKDGLESCHNVVENYRAMLKGEGVDDPSDEALPDKEAELPV